MSTDDEKDQSQEFVIQQGGNLFENVKTMYLNPKHSDVDFCFEPPNPTRKIPAHRGLLPANSDEFAKMFD